MTQPIGSRDGDAAPASGAASSRSTATACRSADDDPGRHPPRGRHAARPRAGALRAHRLRGPPQGRGRQPHRVLQGPRHDDGDHARPRRRARKAVICASTGNTSASAAAYAVRAGHGLRGARPAGQDRARQDGPGAGARREDPPGRRQLRRLPDAGPRACPTTTRWRWSTRSTRSASRGRRRPPSRSSTCSATRPTSTCCRSATRATSPRTGRATRSTRPTAIASPHPAHVGLPGVRLARRSCAARSSRTRTTIATAIRIGNPASWSYAPSRRGTSRAASSTR